MMSCDSACATGETPASKLKVLFQGRMPQARFMRPVDVTRPRRSPHAFSPPSSLSLTLVLSRRSFTLPILPLIPIPALSGTGRLVSNQNETCNGTSS